VVFLSHLLSTECDEAKKTCKERIFNILILSGETEPFGLVVDEVLEIADIVVKPLPQFLKKMNVFSGATIMGSGQISLILDVTGLAEMAHISHIGQRPLRPSEFTTRGQNEEATTKQDMLFFSLNSNGRYCLPMILVHRLEEFEAAQVEVAGQERVVRYGQSILPIINLNAFLGFPIAKDQMDADKITVIVVNKRRRFFGIEVNQILDAANVEGEIEAPLTPKQGILGTIVSGKQIFTIIDVLGVIESLLDQNGDTTKSPNPLSHLLPAIIKKDVKPLRILFAEDTRVFVKHVEQILKQINVELVHAENGQTALQILRNSGPNSFDLILSDIEMPALDGLELARSVRKESKWNHIPMIALSTRFRESDVKTGLEAGFNQYLEKIKGEELLNAIKKQIGGTAS
jgi:two-component system chemotaxis sensor kinase CheA